ncbi:MAG: ribosomal protein L7/L12 [Candidatus Pacebacteria bacterium]|nr:ribosomal protein L7/L12 [Candidatus Paceibacterota bacterium]
MSSYDAPAKIRVIKEYRALVGLGLKEAKDKVEKAPFIAFKGIKKEEAEEIIKKFKGFGAKMKLV